MLASQVGVIFSHSPNRPRGASAWQSSRSARISVSFPVRQSSQTLNFLRDLGGIQQFFSQSAPICIHPACPSLSATSTDFLNCSLPAHQATGKNACSLSRTPSRILCRLKKLMSQRTPVQRVQGPPIFLQVLTQLHLQAESDCSISRLATTMSVHRE